MVIDGLSLHVPLLIHKDTRDHLPFHIHDTHWVTKKITSQPKFRADHLVARRHVLRLLIIHSGSCLCTVKDKQCTQRLNAQALDTAHWQTNNNSSLVANALLHSSQTRHRSRWLVLSSRPTVSLLLVSRKSSYPSPPLITSMLVFKGIMADDRRLAESRFCEPTSLSPPVLGRPGRVSRWSDIIRRCCAEMFNQQC